MLRKAICCCGKTSIQVEGDPRIHLVCHCNNCKRRTGSAFGISAYFPDAQIKDKQGNVEIYSIDNDETEQKRYFCRNCGTTLYWKISRFHGIRDIAHMTGIAGGCFVDDPLPEPVVMSFSAGKCAWLELPNMKSLGPVE